MNFVHPLSFDILLRSYLQESPRSAETQSTFNLPRVLGSDCLYPCVQDALWVSQRQTVRAVTDAKFKSRQAESHKLPSMRCWSGSMPIFIPIHCGFIAYLFLARGKHFPNNIYTSHALACGSFSSVLLVNAVFGLGATLMMNWRMFWSLPRSAAPTHLFTRYTSSRPVDPHMETGTNIRGEWLTIG